MWRPVYGESLAHSYWTELYGEDSLSKLFQGILSGMRRILEGQKISRLRMLAMWYRFAARPKGALQIRQIRIVGSRRCL